MLLERVIVTVAHQKSGFCFDMELPANAPVHQITPSLLAALEKHGYTHRSSRRIYLSYKGVALNEDDTLEGVGVWDGSYLTIDEA